MSICARARGVFGFRRGEELACRALSTAPCAWHAGHADKASHLPSQHRFSRTGVCRHARSAMDALRCVVYAHALALARPHGCASTGILSAVRGTAPLLELAHGDTHEPQNCRTHACALWRAGARRTARTRRSLRMLARRELLTTCWRKAAAHQTATGDVERRRQLEGGAHRAWRAAAGGSRMGAPWRAAWRITSMCRASAARIASRRANTARQPPRVSPSRLGSKRGRQRAGSSIGR